MSSSESEQDCETFGLGWTGNGREELKESFQTLKSAWIYGNALSIYAVGKSYQPKRTKKTEWEQSIQSIEWNQVDEKRRQFINATYAVYMDLQNKMKEYKNHSADNDMIGQNKLLELKKSSHLYRTEMNQYIMTLNEQNITEIATFKSMHAIWHLVELMYLAYQLQETNVAYDYVMWLDVNYPIDMLSMMDEIIQQSTNPMDHEHYWNFVYQLVIRGKIEEAVQLIEYPSAGGYLSSILDNIAAELIESMTAMPQKKDFISATEFFSKWSQWQQSVKFTYERQLKIRGNHNKDLAPYAKIYEMLVGYEKTIVELAGSWQEALGAILLYQVPTIQIHDIRYHVDKVIMKSREELETLDHVLLAIIEQDVALAIRYCTRIDWWFISHLVDLLDHQGEMSQFPIEDAPCALREYFLLEYGTMLVEHVSLWRVGLDYLSTCPVLGRQFLQKYIEKIPIDNEKKAIKVLETCQLFELYEQASTIHCILADRYYRRGQYGPSMLHYIKANEPKRVKKVCDKIIEEYLETGELRFSDMIDNLADQLMCNERLAFLGRYRDFHESYVEKDYNKAGKLVILLPTSDSVPKIFWPTLLIDALPLIENEPIVFDTDETFELMRCLQEITSCHGKEKYLKCITEEQLEVVRLALLRNLSRTMLYADR